MNRGILSIAVLVPILGLLFSCAKPALEDFSPKSAQEKEVLAVFAEMIEARKDQDFYEYMDFFRDDAKIFKRLHPGSNSGSFIPKKEYEESPGEEFGIQLKPTYVQIKTGEDLAILDFWNKHREVWSHMKLEMEKIKGQWRVIKYDYTPYR